MKGFFLGLLVAVIILWRLGIVGVSCTPLSINHGPDDSTTTSFVGTGEDVPLPDDQPTAGDLEPTAADLVRFRGEGFSVSLPGTPERMTKSEGGLRFVVYNVSVGDLYMGISRARVPPGKVRDLDLRAGIRSEAEGYGAILRDETDVRFRGFPARDARLTGVSGCCTVFTRVLVVRNSLFQLQYAVHGSDRSTPAVFKTFIASLRFG